jgi:hypothetical protein
MRPVMEALSFVDVCEMASEAGAMHCSYLSYMSIDCAQPKNLYLSSMIVMRPECSLHKCFCTCNALRILRVCRQRVKRVILFCWMAGWVDFECAYLVMCACGLRLRSRNASASVHILNCLLALCKCLPWFAASWSPSDEQPCSSKLFGARVGMVRGWTF